MYSVVLMMALTAGNATPDWHHRGGCCGCCGGCYGCWGGCFGCFGGCCGGSCFGCCGGCCGGCFGCFGGCCGGGCYGCSGGCCGGGCVGGCYGGGYGSFGGGYGGPPNPDGIVPGDSLMAPAAEVYPSGIGAPAGEPLITPTQNKGKDSDKKGPSTLTSAKATLVVDLPADSKLFVDGMPVEMKEGVQSFDTPALEPGQLYYYTVRVETKRDGKPVSESRRILVHAGQVVRADFKDLEPESVRTAQAR